ncbi:actin-related protein 4 [Diutina catenulata]
MTVYGGDEINAVVLDLGSWVTRIGYAGDDFPKVTVPSLYARVGDQYLFGDDLNVARANVELKPLVDKQLVVDWDAALAQWAHYFEKVLQIDPRDQPLLVTEPVWASFDYRKTLVDKLFERFPFPAVYLAKSPTCVSFQQGRPNCLVVDVGHSSVSVTPVVDGISLLKNSVRTHYSGQFLNDVLSDAFKAKGVDPVPAYKIASKEITVFPEGPDYQARKVPEVSESFERFQVAKIWHELKETALEVPEKALPETKDEDEEFAQRTFELPSGQQLVLGRERFEWAETMFDPSVYKFADEAKAYAPDNGELGLKPSFEERPKRRKTDPPAQDDGATVRGLAKLISHVLNAVDIDLRASAAHNIIVTGGTSLVPQLTERLYAEISAAHPGLKVRLHAVGNSSERVNQAWIGGSVLASLGTFHQLWVSKDEWTEAGAEKILTHRFR